MSLPIRLHNKDMQYPDSITIPVQASDSSVMDMTLLKALPVGTYVPYTGRIPGALAMKGERLISELACYVGPNGEEFYLTCIDGELTPVDHIGLGIDTEYAQIVSTHSWEKTYSQNPNGSVRISPDTEEGKEIIDSYGKVFSQRIRYFCKE